MATEARLFSATIPAGTLKTALATFDMSFPPRIVDEIEIVVPSGPNGLVGFYITSALVQVVPINPGAFVVANNEKIVWPLEGLNDSGSWGLAGYNLGGYAHTIYVRFLLSSVITAVAAGVTLPSAADLSNTGGGGIDLGSLGEQAAAQQLAPAPGPQPIIANPPPSGAFPGGAPAYPGGR